MLERLMNKCFKIEANTNDYNEQNKTMHLYFMDCVFAGSESNSEAFFKIMMRCLQIDDNNTLLFEFISNRVCHVFYFI